MDNKFPRKTVAIVGSRTFAEPALVNKQVEAIPKDWTIFVLEGSGKVAQWATRRAESLNKSVVEIPIDWSEDRAWINAFNRMLQRADCVIVFDDGNFWPRTNGLPTRRVVGKGITEEHRQQEAQRGRENRAMAEYRQQQATEREAIYEEPAPDIYPWHEMELERLRWDDGLHQPKWTDQHVVVVGCHVTRTNSLGLHMEFDVPPQIRVERSRIPDRFLDPDELANLEDFTMDECSLIDQASTMRQFAGRIRWRLANEVPISEDLFEEIKAAVQG